MDGLATATETAAPQVTPRRLLEMLWNFAPPVILGAAIEHHVFDLLDAAPQNVSDLAAASGTSPRGLRMILDALVGLSFLTKQNDLYALTPESSAFLVSTKPAYHGGYVRHIAQMLIPRWLPLGQVVASGKPIRTAMNEDEASEFYRQFVEDLFPLNVAAARTLAAALATTLRATAGNRPPTLLDVAAGAGVWGIVIAQSIPDLQVTAADWPAVLPVAQKVAARYGVADRFRCLRGDIFELDFGSGYTVATLGHLLHCEDESRNRRLLRKTFDALAPGGTIAIAEFNPSEDRTGPVLPLLFAVNMLIHTPGGDSYTFAEISSWLREAGFINPRLLHAPAPSPLILATRPS